MLANVADIRYQPEDSLFVHYLNFIPDQEEDKLFEDMKNMLLEQSYIHMHMQQRSKAVKKQEHLLAKEKGMLKETLDKFLLL